jgi:hypothetical protein
MNRYITVTVITFVVLSALFYAMSIYTPEFHVVALEVANSIMAILTLSAYFIVKRQMNGRAQAFVRGVSGASFLKLMVCMVAVLVYVLINRSHVHKNSVFVMFGIYAVYTAVETVMLSKMARA